MCVCVCDIVYIVLLDFFPLNGGPDFSNKSLPQTGVEIKRLEHIGAVFSSVPPELNIHSGNAIMALLV